MYAGRGETVPLPSVGHLHIQKNGYVYWENDRRWDADLSRQVDSRKAIGKLDPGDPTRMCPNKEYHALFGPGSEPAPFLPVLSYGSCAVLRAAAEKIGCLQVLRSVFPWQWERVFALAVHSICADNSTAQRFPAWSFHSHSGLEKPTSPEEINVVYGKIPEDPESVPRFLTGFRDACHRRFPDSNEVCLAFDSTNQSGSRSNGLAAMGHAKRNRNRPQVNTAVFADEKTGIPLFHEHFVGSILDKTETPFTVEKAVDLGFRKLFLFMDRGCFRDGAARALSDMDMEFGVMAPSNVKAVHDLIHQHGRDFFDAERNIRQANYVEGERIHGIRIPGVDILGGTCFACMCYDYNRATRERNHILGEVEQMRRQLEGRKRWSARMGGDYAPWFTIERCRTRDSGTGQPFRFSTNDVAIEKDLAHAGFFVIASNKDTTPTRMIRAARSRDTDEKVFRRMKWHFGLTSTCTRSLATCEGKMFMAFLTTIVIEAFRWYERDVLSYRASATPHTVLDEMAMYTMQRKSDGSWMPMYAATGSQKEILAAVGLCEDDLAKEIRSVTL